MRSRKEIFRSNVGQTSSYPLSFEVERAEGVFQYDVHGKEFLDLNSGIAVSSLGHCHPRIVEAVQNQVKKYMHTMVYGEHIQSPQLEFATLLMDQIDAHFQSIYFLMSGTEATELAMKLAKRYTGRREIIACRRAYHGSTQGAESLRSDELYKAAYRPLLPGIKHISFNDVNDLSHITEKTAAVISEIVQGEAGVIKGQPEFIKGLKSRCLDMGTLLVADEIQTGFGRTGALFAHQPYSVCPDILLVGKAMGGGMPIAGVISSKDIMNCLISNPDLGHITTFGGHPVSVAAAVATLEELLRTDLISEVSAKANFLADRLRKHEIISEVRHCGLLMAVEPTKRKYLKHIVSKAFDLGVLVDWFLFNDRSFRLAPPLIINYTQLKLAAEKLLEAFDYAQKVYD